MLRSVETVVLDEIHALVPTKRGSHLALSLERLEALCGRKLQRIGLSATQRPLDEVARFLGGADAAPAPKKERPADAAGEILSEFESASAAPVYRDVTIVDAGEPKRIDLRIEVPLDDMSRLDELVTLPSGPASQAPVRPSIWSAIHPKLLELVRATPPPSSSSTAAASPSASRAPSTNSPARPWCARTTAAWPPTSARRSKTA